MSIYRFFELNPDGKIRGMPIQLDCPTDDDALARARILASCNGWNAIQVWLDDRVVGKIDASDIRNHNAELRQPAQSLQPTSA
jgi:hypothetical protein